MKCQWLLHLFLTEGGIVWSRTEKKCQNLCLEMQRFFFSCSVYPLYSHYIPIIMYQGLKMKKHEHHGHVLGQKEAVVEWGSERCPADPTGQTEGRSRQLPAGAGPQDFARLLCQAEGRTGRTQISNPDLKKKCSESAKILPNMKHPGESHQPTFVHTAGCMGTHPAATSL